MKILGFAGSLRSGSYNKIIVKNALKIAKDLGAETEFLDLRDLNLPHYDADVENAGFPKEATKFKEKIESADAVIISSPEYNRSITGPLKNALDWSSRPMREFSFADKPTALITASPGGRGGVSAMEHLVQIMEVFGAKVPEKKISISEVRDKLDENGNITDKETIESIKQLLQELIQISKK